MVEVPLVRLSRWLDGFAQRHGQWTSALAATDAAPAWRLHAEDGTEAVVHAPSWWVDVAGQDPEAGWDPDAPALDGPAVGAPALDALIHVSPLFGVILLRRAGYVVALFHGRALVERKVATRHIHGRTAAGGWSQQRYARRRANQAEEISGACAGAAAQILARPHRSPVQFLVTGGDRPLLSAVLGRLPEPLSELPVRAHLPVGTPDRQVLAGLPDRVLAVRIDLPGPGPDLASGPLASSAPM